MRRRSVSTGDLAGLNPEELETLSASLEGQTRAIGGVFLIRSSSSSDDQEEDSQTPERLQLLGESDLTLAELKALRRQNRFSDGVNGRLIRAADEGASGGSTGWSMSRRRDEAKMHRRQDTGYSTASTSTRDSPTGHRKVARMRGVTSSIRNYRSPQARSTGTQTPSLTAPSSKSISISSSQSLQQQEQIHSNRQMNVDGAGVERV
ncbi:uncharacterized protein LOC143033775 [Oratosquilla oratoria]|uniref:uncharacterized protein LOC143033775 n=1 Tax=Oratosquilla oratoria TaxID=337810 RepID=UPI003F76A1B9